MNAEERRARELVYERSGGCCERCGQWGVTYDHRKPRSQGGDWAPSNGMALCGNGTMGCHGWKEHHPRAAATLGFRVWSHETPRKVPVFRRGRMVFLDDKGGFSERQPDGD
ncbi:hypothetical protein GCM10023147_20540 [Tsukamurella soli]|uniref:HNH nuclease domain-containing protein n=1 Tax=Tsukamurella soli TaxID=644556 RepID=A0ABP8JIS7_9ACTN